MLLQICVFVSSKEPQETCNTVSCLLLLTAYVCELFTVKTLMSSPRSHMREARSVTRSEICLTPKRLLQRKASVYRLQRAYSTPLKANSSSRPNRQLQLWSGSPRSLYSSFPFSHTNTHYLMKYVAQHCSSLFKLSTSFFHTHLFIQHTLIH